MKVYIKRGILNYREQKLVTQINAVIAKKLKTDADFESTISPVHNFADLTALHDRLCTQNIDHEDVTEKEDADDPEVNDQQERDDFKQGVEDTLKSTQTSSVLPVDPFNDGNPIVRDYVLEEGFEKNGAENQDQSQQSTFEEPTNYQESFDLPSKEEEQSGAKAGSSKEEKEKKEKKPINPAFDGMDTGRKKRSTKKLATMIIDAVDLLAEKGCIWWTTKDITEDKLVQYELEGNMNLQLLLTLDNGQQTTVRNWFTQKVAEATELFKTTKQDKEDLVDSLYEVLMEKGAALTPMQELMVNAGKVYLLDKGLSAFGFGQQIKGVLNQLVMMNEGMYTPPAAQATTASPTQQQEKEEEYAPDLEEEHTENPAMESSLQIIKKTGTEIGM